jgi:hypothetical protein
MLVVFKSAWPSVSWTVFRSVPRTDDGVETRIVALNPTEVEVEQFDCRELPFTQRPQHLSCWGEAVKYVHGLPSAFAPQSCHAHDLWLVPMSRPQTGHEKVPQPPEFGAAVVDNG